MEMRFYNAKIMINEKSENVNNIKNRTSIIHVGYQKGGFTENWATVEEIHLTILYNALF